MTLRDNLGGTCGPPAREVTESGARTSLYKPSLLTTTRGTLLSCRADGHSGRRECQRQTGAHCRHADPDTMLVPHRRYCNSAAHRRPAVTAPSNRKRRGVQVCPLMPISAVDRPFTFSRNSRSSCRSHPRKSRGFPVSNPDPCAAFPTRFAALFNGSSAVGLERALGDASSHRRESSVVADCGCKRPLRWAAFGRKHDAQGGNASPQSIGDFHHAGRGPFPR